MPPPRSPVPVSSRTILACGGHEFSAAPGNPELGDFLLTLSPAETPRICLLPTASGDPEEQITAFRRFFASRGADPSHLSLFRLEQAPARAGSLLEPDIIYVGGGSLINLIAILRAHRVDRALVEAWRRGVVLCGQSAGAMCWFEHGITRSAGAAIGAEGLGILPGSLSVHYHRDADRRGTLLEAIAGGAPAGWGVDDQAALLFRGRALVGTFSGRDGAGAWRIEPSGEGDVSERELDADRLRRRRRGARSLEAAAIDELRMGRAARAGVLRREPGWARRSASG